jgi:hypothetical protein
VRPDTHAKATRDEEVEDKFLSQPAPIVVEALSGGNVGVLCIETTNEHVNTDIKCGVIMDTLSRLSDENLDIEAMERFENKASKYMDLEMWLEATSERLGQSSLTEQEVNKTTVHFIDLQKAESLALEMIPKIILNHDAHERRARRQKMLEIVKRRSHGTKAAAINLVESPGNEVHTTNDQLERTKDKQSFWRRV